MKTFLDMINEKLEDESFSPTEISDDNEKTDEETQDSGTEETNKDKSPDEPANKEEENPADEEAKKEEEKSLVALSKARKKKIKEIRDRFIEEFNAENEGKTRLKIAAYEPFNDFIKSIKVTYEIDPEEIYLAKDKYDDGDAWLELNDIFFKDINSVASKLGIKRIEWKRDDDARFGNLILSDKLEKSI